MRQIPIPQMRREPATTGRSLRGRSGARGNNLKNVTAEIPLGTFTCVTGVSGGGKIDADRRDALQGAGASG